jgi:hypothetical protein
MRHIAVGSEQVRMAWNCAWEIITAAGADHLRACRTGDVVQINGMPRIGHIDDRHAIRFYDSSEWI